MLLVQACRLGLAVGAVVLSQVWASAVLEVELHAFFNLQHTLANGMCCSGNCNTDCSNRFQFCLRPYGQSREEPGCPRGSHTTGVVAGDLTVFQQGQRLEGSTPNPLTFSTHTWNGGFQLQVMVEHVSPQGGVALVAEFWIEVMLHADGERDEEEDDGGEGGSGGGGDESKTENEAQGGPTLLTVTSEQRQTLILSYRLTCRQNYFGGNCSVFCEPQDDYHGHYLCDGLGNKVCLEGYRDSSTNCTECVPAQSCSSIMAHCPVPVSCQCPGGYSAPSCTDTTSSLQPSSTASTTSKTSTTLASPSSPPHTPPPIPTAPPHTPPSKDRDTRTLVLILSSLCPALLLLAGAAGGLAVACVVLRGRTSHRPREKPQAVVPLGTGMGEEDPQLTHTAHPVHPLSGQSGAVGSALTTDGGLHAFSNPLYTERPASLQPGASSLQLEMAATPQLSPLVCRASGDMGKHEAQSGSRSSSRDASHRSSSREHTPSGLMSGHKGRSTLSESFTFSPGPPMGVSPSPPVGCSGPPPTKLNTLV